MKLLRTIRKKTIGPDKIPPKIVRLSAKLLILIKSRLQTMISVIILSQMRQNLQQSNQSINRKVATKLKMIHLSAYIKLFFQGLQEISS